MRKMIGLGWKNKMKLLNRIVAKLGEKTGLFATTVIKYVRTPLRECDPDGCTPKARILISFLREVLAGFHTSEKSIQEPAIPEVPLQTASSRKSFCLKVAPF